MDEASPIDLDKALGVAERVSPDRLALYIPSRDRENKEIDSKPWLERALSLLTLIGGGATVMPPSEGMWLNPDTGELIRETVLIVYTYIDPDRLAAHLSDLRAFLHEMGRQTGQGEVVCDYNGSFLKIRTFD